MQFGRVFYETARFVALTCCPFGGGPSTSSAIISGTRTPAWVRTGSGRYATPSSSYAPLWCMGRPVGHLRV